MISSVAERRVPLIVAAAAATALTGGGHGAPGCTSSQCKGQLTRDQVATRAPSRRFHACQTNAPMGSRRRPAPSATQGADQAECGVRAAQHDDALPATRRASSPWSRAACRARAASPWRPRNIAVVTRLKKSSSRYSGIQQQRERDADDRDHERHEEERHADEASGTQARIDFGAVRQSPQQVGRPARLAAPGTASARTMQRRGTSRKTK